MRIKNFIPILDWLPNYKKSFLRDDIVAGITVGIVLIPQGIAYALIAGLPPIYGLYTALIPQLIYAIFGTARQVAVGPVAMDSLIVATGVSTLALAGSQSYIEIAVLLAFVVGAIQLLMGILRLGFIVNFLSRPVITGFTSAVAIIIGLNQLGNLLGVSFVKSDQIHLLIGDFVRKISQLNVGTTIIGVASCSIIVVLKKINKKIPNALVVVLLGILVMTFFGDYFLGVAIVRDIPSGLPTFSIPEIDIDQIRELLPIAITLVLVGYLETISIGKTLEAKQDIYRVDANQELVALGLGNVFGSFFKSYPATSSFSRSAINEDAGAITGLAGIVASIMVIITLLFLTPVFYNLPKTILASIIMVSVVKIINIKEARYLWRANNLDFWLAMATFFATLIFGVEYGILTGVGLSLIVLIFRTSRPYVAELGKVPDSNFYRNINRFEEVIVDKDVLVFRFDAQLFYANADYFRECLEEMVDRKGEHLKLIVLDAESINRTDSTGVEMLKDRIKFYKKRGIAFYFAGVKGPVRDALFRGGVLGVTDIDHFFMRVNGAVTFYKTGDNENQKRYAQYIHQSYD